MTVAVQPLRQPVGTLQQVAHSEHTYPRPRSHGWVAALGGASVPSVPAHSTAMKTAQSTCIIMLQLSVRYARPQSVQLAVRKRARENANRGNLTPRLAHRRQSRPRKAKKKKRKKKKG